MPQQQIDDREVNEPWLALPLALSPEAERLTGADFAPMLYVAAEQRYIKLSPGAARLVDALDGGTTAAEILAGVSGDGDPGLAARRRDAVLRTLDSLRRAGAFTLARGTGATAAVPGWRRRLAQPPRVRFTSGIGALVARPAALVARHPRASRIVLAALALASLALCLAGGLRFARPSAVVWPVVAAAILFEVAVHELAHATVCRVYGIRAREAGVMLWGWFLPLAYVDCTDIYRLPGRRPRILVALAGPYVDLVAAGAFAAVALTGSGAAAGTAWVVFLSLVLMLARNLTPLLPTDGYHALEAATGELNLRRRAWRQLRAAPRTRRERVYAAYAAITAAYTVAMVALVLIELRAVVRLLG